MFFNKLTAESSLYSPENTGESPKATDKMPHVQNGQGENSVLLKSSFRETLSTLSIAELVVLVLTLCMFCAKLLKGQRSLWSFR